MKLLSCECHQTPLMISEHWPRWWLSGYRQQAITWANVYWDHCRPMTSLSHNELIYQSVTKFKIRLDQTVLEVGRAVYTAPCVSTCKIFHISWPSLTPRPDHRLFNHVSNSGLETRLHCPIQGSPGSHVWGGRHCSPHWLCDQSHPAGHV